MIVSPVTVATHDEQNAVPGLAFRVAGDKTTELFLVRLSGSVAAIVGEDGTPYRALSAIELFDVVERYFKSKEN